MDKFVSSDVRVSRVVWRKLCKKLRRKRHRQASARLRDELLEKEVELFKRDNPSWEDDIKREKQFKELLALQEEENRNLNHQAWLERESVAQNEWQKMVARQARELQIRESNERLIREEWKAMKENEERKKQMEADSVREREKQQSLLLLEALSGLNEAKTHNPPVPVNIDQRSIQTKPGVSLCSFYRRTGCCRFGHRCSRNHVQALLSSTLLLENFFLPRGVRYTRYDEQCEDVNLEVGDDEMAKLFSDFYHDVIEELQRCGHVTQLLVCQNRELHLRGNLYVQYGSENEAARAFSVFNGRWYAGRQINARFVEISSWKAAICGDFLRKCCSKGSICNFLHPYSNPGASGWFENFTSHAHSCSSVTVGAFNDVGDRMKKHNVGGVSDEKDLSSQPRDRKKMNIPFKIRSNRSDDVCASTSTDTKKRSPQTPNAGKNGPNDCTGNMIGKAHTHKSSQFSDRNRSPSHCCTSRRGRFSRDGSTHGHGRSPSDESSSGCERSSSRKTYNCERSSNRRASNREESSERANFSYSRSSRPTGRGLSSSRRRSSSHERSSSRLDRRKRSSESSDHDRHLSKKRKKIRSCSNEKSGSTVCTNFDSKLKKKHKKNKSNSKKRSKSRDKNR